MRACPWTLACFLLTPALAGAQVTISPNTVVEGGSSVIVLSGGVNNLSDKTNLSNATVVLNGASGSPSLATNTSSPISIGNLEINSRANFSLRGSWLVSNQIKFTQGLIVAPSGSKLIYIGSADAEGNDNSYVQGSFFVRGQAGLRTFPIGDNIYAPAALVDIEPADANTEIGFGISANPGFTVDGSIKEIFQDRFWQITVNGGNSVGSYLGSQISLSTNGTDPSFAEAPTILERKTDGTTNDLGAGLNNIFFTSNSITNAEGKFYAIAKTDNIKLKVHKLITPDNDQVNDVLVIEGVDNFENEVTILDRWGVPVKKWTNFKNYLQPTNAEQADFNFTRLALGNYIVVVKYNERGATKSEKQMITVLK